VSTKRQWIAEQAREHPDRVFTSLHHLIDLDWMLEAWALTRKDGAVGIDGQTADDYEKALEANLECLLTRIRSGSYRAPPVRRHYIPKADGSRRPLGIPTIEDKVAWARDRDAAGADLRGGLSGLLVRLPAAAVGS